MTPQGYTLAFYNWVELGNYQIIVVLLRNNNYTDEACKSMPQKKIINHAILIMG